MSRTVMVACIIMLTQTACAWPLNVVPASNNARGWFAIPGSEADAMYDAFHTALTEQGYDFSYRKDSGISDDPECRPHRFIGFCEDGIGMLFLSAHGNGGGFQVSTYAYSIAGRSNWNADLNWLTNNGYVWDRDFTYFQEQYNYYAIVLTDQWTTRYGGYDDDNASGVVFAACCSTYGFATSWGAKATLAYDRDRLISEMQSDAELVLQSLDGKRGTPPDCRMLTNAIVGCDASLRLVGDGNWVLAPTIESVSPLWGSVEGVGPFEVNIEFDVEMYPCEASNVLDMTDGYVLEDGQLPGYDGPAWVSGSVLRGFVLPVNCPGAVEPKVAAFWAKSASGQHTIDGGTGASVGCGPNRDDYSWEFSTDAAAYDCNLWETNVELCGAFGEEDGTTVYWLSEYQDGSLAYDIYEVLGEARELVGTVPAFVVEPDLPVGYATTTLSNATVFQIVERDGSGKETPSRPFMRGERPEGFQQIISTGRDGSRFPEAPAPTETHRGVECSDEGRDGLPRPYYIFVSSRQTFLDACQPVVAKLESLDRPVAAVLADRSPESIWSALEPYY